MSLGERRRSLFCGGWLVQIAGGQSLAACLDIPPCGLKTVFRAVIRVNDVTTLLPFNMVQQKGDVCFTVRGSEFFQGGKVGAVKGDDVIKPVEVLLPDLTCPQDIGIQPMPTGRGTGTGVWPVAFMPVARPGGIDVDHQAAGFSFPAHGEFGQWRAAYVAGADKKERWCRGCICHECVSHMKNARVNMELIVPKKRTDAISRSIM